MKITHCFQFFATVVCLLTIISCSQEEVLVFPHTDLTQSPLIPQPTTVSATKSAFGLDRLTAITSSVSDDAYTQVAKFLGAQIRSKTAADVALTFSDETKRIIQFRQSNSRELDNDEAYRLDIGTDSIIITSKTAEGAFRAVQTIEQLIPSVSNDTITNHSMWLIPTGTITDSPFFEYRGAMLDVARHFFSVAEVKKYIDALTYYKINKLHLHLTDDQGWRIEIKSWPKLTEIGGATEVGGGKGGYYTQEDYKEIVQYAADRFITIIPEVDMPGHTNAASLAYPILNGNGKKLEAYTGMKVGFSTFDARKDTVYAFIDDVVREISAITPGPYFHIGGDESHVTPKNDYILFVSKVEKIVESHGKRMIGWDEITQSDIGSKSIAQHWHTAENATNAVKNGQQVIMSPAKKAYLDMKYDTASEYGLNWAAYIPVDTAYIWNPENYIDGLSKSNILGIEAPLWSETISNSAELEYLAFPRVIGYAEIGWSLPQNRKWEDYKERLAKQGPYLRSKNINYYETKLVDWE